MKKKGRKEVEDVVISYLACLLQLLFRAWHKVPTRQPFLLINGDRIVLKTKPCLVNITGLDIKDTLRKALLKKKNEAKRAKSKPRRCEVPAIFECLKSMSAAARV